MKDAQNKLSKRNGDASYQDLVAKGYLTEAILNYICPVSYTHLVCAVGEGLYLNPAIPEAADYVVQGVAELVQNYAVDGIHFDD